MKSLIGLACLLLAVSPVSLPSPPLVAAEMLNSAERVDAAERPNFVFIFADDLGYADLGCYGHPYAKTPAIDKLAAEGTALRQFYVSGVTCCPSRTGLMTGLFPARFQRYPADYGFGDRVTVTELLHKHGYRTGHFGKWHMGPKSTPGTYGIDEIGVKGGNRRDPRGRDADLFDEAIRFIEANQDRPFYVNVWGHITHFPVDPHPDLLAEFRDVTVDRDDFSRPMQEKFDQCKALGGDLDVAMRKYLADVYSLDNQVGRLLAKIDELGLRKKTIVVFSSDHGPAPVRPANGKNDTPQRAKFAVNMLGYAGEFRGGKHNQYEGGVRVPFIVRWPGHVPAGRVDETSVTTGVDWLPTVCRLAGIRVDDAKLDGEDVSAVWLGEKRERGKPIFWKTNSARSAPAVRSGRWKLHGTRLGRRGGVLELYDLSTDAGERKNLADERPEIVARLKRQLDAWTATLPKSYEKGRDEEE